VKKNSKTTKLIYKVTVKKPKLSKNKLSLVSGKTAKLSVKNKPKKAKYTWQSSNPKVATVNKNGKVVSKAKGTANIKVKVKTAKKTYSLSCKVTVKAKTNNPEAQTYTVTFNSNGGSAVIAQTVTANGKATQPTAPTRRGYTFDGWYTAANGGTLFDFNTAITKNITLYAHWIEKPTEKPQTYTVTFDSNGGSTITPQTVEANMRVTQPETPTKEGYVFSGWYTDKELVYAFDFSTEITRNIILYAKWTDAGSVYTVTFITNSDSTDNFTQSVEKGKTLLRPADPTREGYIFSDWYTNEELTDKYDFNSAVNNNFNLYAGWTAINVHITIDPGSYDETTVNRDFNVSVTSDIAVTNISYTLKSANKTETIELGTSAGDYTANVLLEGGENVFTVSVETTDGSTTTKEIIATYDSGYIYDEDFSTLEDYTNNGFKLVPVYADDADQGKDEPDEYLIANVLNLYFSDNSSLTEREMFIKNNYDAEPKGYLSSLSMMTAQLNTPVTTKNTLTTTELYDEVIPRIEEYSETLASASDNEIFEGADVEMINTSVDLDFISNDKWEESPKYWDAEEKGEEWGEWVEDADWWLSKVSAKEAWQYDNFYNSDFFTPIITGVIDGGFEIDHSDLRNQIGVISKENSPHDHGTHVAGIIGAIADNNNGIAGVMHNTTTNLNSYIIAYDGYKENEGIISDSKIQKGIAALVEAGSKVVNMSLGLSKKIPSGSFNTSANIIKYQGVTFSKAFGKLLEKGFDFIIVQSAGNGNAGSIGVDYKNNRYFASINNNNCYESGPFVSNSNKVSKSDIIDRILIVSNIQFSGNENNMLNSASNGGTGDLNVIAAPGTNIYSTVTGNSYNWFDGTSMAAPLVTGICGLTWSVNKSLSGAEVVEIVKNNTKGIAETNPASLLTHTTGGMGIVNALKAVEAAKNTLPVYTGSVVDATTGDPIHATITIHKDTLEGNIVGNDTGTYYCDEDGKFTLPQLPYGNYVFEIAAEGYISIPVLYAANKNDSQKTINLGEFPLSTKLNDDDYRIVLWWGEAPRDLDSHLVANAYTGRKCHVYYYNMNPSPGYANLDIDDTSSYGPETITITNFAGLSNIRYAVHDYSNRSSSSSSALANSNAYVVVYKGDSLLQVFYVPKNIGGTEWDVFAFDASGNIIPLNQMKYCSDEDDVLSNYY